MRGSKITIHGGMFISFCQRQLVNTTLQRHQLFLIGNTAMLANQIYRRPLQALRARGVFICRWRNSYAAIVNIFLLPSEERLLFSIASIRSTGLPHLHLYSDALESCPFAHGPIRPFAKCRSFTTSGNSSATSRLKVARTYARLCVQFGPMWNRRANFPQGHRRS